MRKLLAYCFMFFGCLFFATSHAAVPIKWQKTYIPMQEAGPQGLETLLVWPDDGKKHPLLLLTNGSPDLATQRANLTAISLLPIATKWAKRHFAVAYVLRRGYGSSGGSWMENYGNCSFDSYKQAGAASAKDLQTAIDYLGTLPQFDTKTIVAVGYSAGGFAVIALSTNPPRGLRAVISLAGGRGADGKGHVCGENALVDNFAALGEKSTIPMLWLYAKNDHLFNPRVANSFYEAFTSHGGHATFIAPPAFGDNGHYWFATPGPDIWIPLADAFLRKQHLLQEPFLDVLEEAPLSPPEGLTEKESTAFNQYALAPPHKAFANDGRGAFGWRTSKRTVAEAKKAALKTCQMYSKHICKVLAVDDVIF